MTKATRFLCDAEDCGEAVNGELPANWRAVSVSYNNMRKETVRRERHYCGKCFEAFSKFIGHEADADDVHA